MWKSQEFLSSLTIKHNSKLKFAIQNPLLHILSTPIKNSLKTLHVSSQKDTIKILKQRNTHKKCKNYSWQHFFSIKLGNQLAFESPKILVSCGFLFHEDLCDSWNWEIFRKKIRWIICASPPHQAAQYFLFYFRITVCVTYGIWESSSRFPVLTFKTETRKSLKTPSTKSLYLMNCILMLD